MSDIVERLLLELRQAAERQRYPGEELRCEYMRALDEALNRTALEQSPKD